MVSWTGMITCYPENDCFEDALELFYQMRMVGFKPNNFTFASVPKAFLDLEALDAGQSTHALVIKSQYEEDQFVGLALLDLYTKSGDIVDACWVFEEMRKTDVVPWSFMIA
ncbi:Pentatricopeptide repeat [Trema orientale]|uniref:Pentatricopeptide repeat n=1 Tax=Trema orientale TaxID=63057 RepID=A0A2P5EQ58_TREOI|nr:Pentatricopeptide repeat [Trema orientale]